MVEYLDTASELELLRSVAPAVPEAAAAGVLHAFPTIAPVESPPNSCTFWRQIEKFSAIWHPDILKASESFATFAYTVLVVWKILYFISIPNIYIYIYLYIYLSLSTYIYIGNNHPTSTSSLHQLFGVSLRSISRGSW